MKVLVVGLGSMGKRRIRNLRALGISDLAGMDPREDRRNETAEKYGLSTFADVEQALERFRPTALVVSTSPERHMDYAYLATARNLPCFIEASVVDADRIRELHEITSKDGPLVAPSCTMRYFPGPKKVKELLARNTIGKVLCVNYHTGQYLRDWHPWEAIEDYYVSKRDTGGCREIIPFELTWLNDLFGEPTPVACLRDTLGDLGVDIDDVYHFWLRYPAGVIANMTIEVLSRPQATRELRILGSHGQIVFSADDNSVRVCTVDSPAWIRHELAKGRAEQGYINPEEPYIDEMRDFITAVETHNPAAFPNSLLEDYKVLGILNALEK